MEVDINDGGARNTLHGTGTQGSMENESRSANSLGQENNISSKDSFENRQPTSFTSTTHEPQIPDLVTSIRGLYRVLDLINEQGSGGLGTCTRS